MLFRKKDPASADASARRRRLAKPAAAALVLVLAAGSLVAFRVSSARKEEPAKDPAATVLEFTPADVALVELRNLARTIPISGSLSPVTKSTVRSKVPGEVRKVHVREGEKVAQGQLLAEIDTADLQARLDAQVAALEEAKARLGIAAKNRDNGKALRSQGFISQNALDTTQSEFEAAAVRSAEAQVRLARNAMDDALVRSPIDGIVATRMVNPGERASVDGALFAIVDLARMEVEAPVPASEIPGVRPGQSAVLRVDGFGNREFAGKLERINPTTEQASRAITVYLSVSNRDGALRGGMFAKGSLVLDEGESAPAIPLTAVREEAGQSFVFTLEKGKIGRRAVTLGRRVEEAGLVQVRSGLDGGETVVRSRATGLKAGSPAVLKDAAAPAAKAG